MCVNQAKRSTIFLFSSFASVCAVHHLFNVFLTFHSNQRGLFRQKNAGLNLAQNKNTVAHIGSQPLYNILGCGWYMGD